MQSKLVRNTFSQQASILLAGCCFHPLKEKLKDILIKNSVSTNSREKNVPLATENLFCFFSFMTAPSEKRLYQSRNKTQAVQKANKEANVLCSLSSHLCTKARWPACYRTIQKQGRKSSCLRSSPLPDPQCAHLEQLIQCSLNSSHLV